MPKKQQQWRKRAGCIALVCSGFFLASCSNDQQAVQEQPRSVPTLAASTANAQRADQATGKVLVQAQCVSCHALMDAGIEPAPHPIARPLDKIGIGHDQQWFITQLSQVCRPSQSNTACIPAHAVVNTLLTPQQRDQVIAYLLSLH